MGKLPLFFLFISCLLFSCSKDLKHTNKIHGTWEITSLQEYSGDGNTFSTDPEGVFQFDKCQVLEDEFRAFRQQYSYSHGSSTISKNETGIYKFDDEGRLLTIRIPDDNGYHQTVYHLISLKNKKLVIEHIRSQNDRTILTLEKK